MSSFPLTFQAYPDYEILQSLLNSLPVGVFMVRMPDAQPVFMNSKAVEILEQQLNPDATVNSLSQTYHAYKFGTDEFYKPSEMPITAGLEGRSLVIDDMELRFPDGRRKLLLATGSPVYDTKGNLAYSLAAFYDITEQAQIKNELKRSELRFKTLVANSSDVLVILDHNGKEIFVSDSSETITGYTPEELMKVGGHHFVSPADLPRIQASYLKLLTDKNYIFHEEYMFRHKSGKWLVIEAYARNFLDHPAIQGIVVNFRNNTEKKEIEEALLKSEELYRTLSEHVPVGLYRFRKSPEGVYSFPYLSNTILKITATDSKLKNNDFNSLIALVHPDHQELILSELYRSENDLGIFKQEFLFLREAAYIWLEARAIPKKQADGSIIWNGVLIDINETKLTQLALIHERERLKNVIEGTDAGTWEFNFQTWEIILNEKFSQITDFSLDEIASYTFRKIVNDLVHAEDVKTLFRIFREHSNGNSANFEAEIRILNQTKNWVWVSLKGKIITRTRSNKPEWFFGTIVNIHQRKLLEIEQYEANQKLIESERKYRELYESSKDGIVRINMDGYILDANDSFVRMLGYDSVEELTGTFMDYTPEKWHSYELHIIESLILTRGFSDEYEKEYIRKDGSIFPISLKTWLITVNGKPVGMWAIVRDISVQKRTEEELRKLLQHMEMFNKHLQDAREKERAGIASAIHDELGQAMTALKLDLGWMLDNLKGQSLIRQKIVRMLLLTESTIKEVQRISAELRPGVLDTLGLAAAIEWYCSEFQQRSGICCNLSLNLLPRIEKDLELVLFRIIQEALTNVIRHSKAGKVDVTLDHNSREILLFIADNGVGINKDDLISGKSFGLMGMRERVSYFNGSIQFVNHTGTTVKVSIPLKNSSHDQSPEN